MGAAGDGTWNGTTENWASDSSGTTYGVWSNGSAAEFGATNGERSVTVAGDFQVSALRYSATTANDWNLNAASSQTITLVKPDPDTAPSVFVDGNGGADISFADANLVLAGTDGFVKTGSGDLLLSGNVAHTISGPVEILGGEVIVGSGRMLNVTTYNVSGTGTALRTNNNNVDRIADTAAINLSAGGTFNYGGSGGASNTETVGSLNFVDTSGQISANTSPGRLAIGAMDRGTTGTVRFSSLFDSDANISVTGTKPPTDVTLAWAVGNALGGTGQNAIRFIEYDSATDRFALVASTAAPTDVSTWLTANAGGPISGDIHYDWGTINSPTGPAFTGTLSGDLTLNTLAIGPTSTSQGANSLDLGGNQLTLAAFAGGSQGGTPGSVLTVTNGFFTAPDGVEQLYIHNFGGFPTTTYDVAIGRTGSADLTYDVIVTALSSIAFTSGTDSAYIGDMYLQGTNSVTLSGAGRKTGGDLFIRDGVTLGQASGVSEQLADGGVVDLATGATWNFVTGAGTETIKGLTGTGTLNIANGTSSAKVLIVDTDGPLNDSPADYTFAGLIASTASSAAARIEKTGAGVWTLTGDNTYDLQTVVSGGTLEVEGSHDNPTSGRGYTIQNGGTLGGSGSISLTDGDVTVEAGGGLAPGSSPGTLTLDLGTGSLDLAGVAGGGAGTLIWELGNAGNPASNDLILLNSGFLDIGIDLLRFTDFNFVPGAGFGAGGEYTLVATGNSVIGSLDPVLANLQGQVGGLDATLGFSLDGTDLILTVVPEPSLLLLVAVGLGVLMVVLRRSRVRAG